MYEKLSKKTSSLGRDHNYYHHNVYFVLENNPAENRRLIRQYGLSSGVFKQ